ncbi:hypothetical protein CL616_03525 [archaeon]|nr:hypothetical protein [archaeon]
MNLKIKNRKNEEIVILVEQANNPKGLVFIMHGLGGFKEQTQIITFANAFKENNFTVVKFDTTNTFGESGGSYEEATTTNYFEDLEDIIQWSKNQNWYQEPFCLVGHSLGGMSITLFAEKYPEKVKALAPISTVISGKLHTESIPKEKLEEYNNTGWKIGKSASKPGLIKKLKWKPFHEDLKKYDLLKDAHKLTMPILFIVGEKDNGTPLKHQKLLYDKVVGEKEIHIIKDAPHTFTKQEHLNEIKEIFKKWISKLL